MCPYTGGWLVTDGRKGQCVHWRTAGGASRHIAAGALAIIRHTKITVCFRYALAIRIAVTTAATCPESDRDAGNGLSGKLIGHFTINMSHGTGQTGWMYVLCLSSPRCQQAGDAKQWQEDAVYPIAFWRLCRSWSVEMIHRNLVFSGRGRIG